MLEKNLLFQKICMKKQNNKIDVNKPLEQAVVRSRNRRLWRIISTGTSFPWLMKYIKEFAFTLANLINQK